MPTLMGYDPDHARSLGEVGREGVSVATIDDMMRLFGDIPLDQVSTSMTINAPAAVLLALYVAVAEQPGRLAATKLRGTLQNDMLKEFIAQKEWISPIRGHMRIIRDMLAWCTRTMPQWNTISISGYHIREAGATAVQELAFTIADGIGYVQLGIDAGLDVDEFAPRLSYFWDVHNDFFEEIAKFRAGRRMWAKIMRERFGAKNPRSWLLRTHAQTAGVSLMAQQPLNNVVRTTMQALAAVLGGTQSLHTNSYDETYALPTEDAARARAAHAAGHLRGDRRRERRRSARRQLLRRDADRSGRGRGVGVHQQDRRDGRHREGRRGRLSAARDRARGVRVPARGRQPAAARSSASTSTSTEDEGDHIPTLKIEHAIEHGQIDRIKTFRGDARRGGGRRARSPRCAPRSATTSRT